MAALNHTHDPQARSWLASANDAACDFPIQNLPLAEFRRRGTDEAFRGGCAIGDQIVDLAAVARTDLLDGAAQAACAAPSSRSWTWRPWRAPTCWMARRRRPAKPARNPR